MKKLYKLALPVFLTFFSSFLFCIPVSVKAQEFMRANLYIVDTSNITLMDGNRTDYNINYSNAVDINDAWKMTNPGVNFGILRDGYNLVVERRSMIVNTDTTFFKMWNLTPNHYRLKLILNDLDHPGLTCILKDNYLLSETQISLDDTSHYDFIIDANTSSADKMRFQLIYRPSIPLNENIIFTAMGAKRADGAIKVDWSVTNEVSVASYLVEKSSDGLIFNNIENIIPGVGSASKTYQFNDTRAAECESYYRIKVIKQNGNIQYSVIAKVPPLVKGTSIIAYPNPVVNKTIQLYFNNSKTGLYKIILINSSSVKQQLTSKYIISGQSIQTLELPKGLAPGMYHLIISGPERYTKSFAISVL